MVDSDFWKDIGNQFRSIEDCQPVMAQWIDVPGSASLENWNVWGGKVTPRLKFEALARRAGSKLEPGCKDALAAWLSALKREGRRDLVKATGNLDHFQDDIATQGQAGRIQCVCAVSADYCLLLESRALDEEHTAAKFAQPSDSHAYTEKQNVGQQIDALRLECQWTAEHLAEMVEITPRSVYRHLSGVDIPSKLNLARYRRIF